MRVGTHNLQDRDGRVTLFAAVLLFTEAIPQTIRARLATRWARLRGYRLLVCRQQRDLCIAYSKRLFTLDAVAYYRAHGGEAYFTPHRGTFVAKGRLRDGTRLALLVEHRIQGSFNPRASRLADRVRLWEMHQAMTLFLIKTLHAQGYVVIAGGDLNTWRGHSGYNGVLREVGQGLDRLAVSGRLGRLVDVEHLSRQGSNHKRLLATLKRRRTRPARRSGS